MSVMPIKKLNICQMHTHLIPTQALEPFPKGTKYLSRLGLLIHRSGMNSLGFGNIDSFMRISTLVMETGVFGGMTISPYLIAVSGANRGSRVTIPWARRIPSWTHPLRYGSCSNLCQSSGFVEVDPAAANSFRRFWRISGALLMWKLATVRAHEVVTRPAAMISCASSPRRASDFSAGGRSLLSNSWKIVGWSTCL